MKESVEEILKFAIATEIESNQFYLALAEAVDNPQMCEVFKNIAEEELEHKAKLELEVMKLGKTIKTQEVFDSSGKNYIISNTKEPLDMDYKDMLLLAIEKENASFELYVKLTSKTEDSHLNNVYLSLAEEEIKHKLRFQAEYDIITENK